VSSLDDVLALRTAVIVRDGIDNAAAVRETLRYARYTLVDRGSYSFASADEPAVIEQLRALAAERTGRALTVTSARALRFDPGDYLLARHDVVVEHGIEVVADLSPAIVDGAEVHYRQHGRVLFRMPSMPNAVAIVPRTAAVSANHTYVSRRQPATAVRLVVQLAG
jgi:hypothetical protein